MASSFRPPVQHSDSGPIVGGETAETGNAAEGTGDFPRRCEAGRGSDTEVSGKRIKQAIFAAIAAHIFAHGRHQWDLVREREEFRHLIGREAGPTGRRRFWRWVKAVSEPGPRDQTRPHEARDAASAALRLATEQARLAAQKNLPAAPSPAYLMRAGAEGARNLDFLAVIPLIWSDAERLREHAMKPDETAADGKQIADAKLFDTSIHRRLAVVETAVRVMREIWDLDHQRRFYDAITRIIVEELASVPEIQRRVVEQLSELNASTGMTIHAEVG